MAASQYMLKEYGFVTRAVVNPLVSSAGTTTVRVLNDNPDRIAWFIINLSANIVYISYSPDVSSTKGIILAANGGTANSTVRDDGDAVTYEIWAKAAADNSTIYVIEYVKS
jgi:hypothetical protein